MFGVQTVIIIIAKKLYSLPQHSFIIYFQTVKVFKKIISLFFGLCKYLILHLRIQIPQLFITCEQNF